MKLKTSEAHNSCGHFGSKNIKNGSVVKKLFPKNLGVSNELWDTVYLKLDDAIFRSYSSAASIGDKLVFRVGCYNSKWDQVRKIDSWAVSYSDFPKFRSERW